MTSYCFQDLFVTDGSSRTDRSAQTGRRFHTFRSYRWGFRRAQRERLVSFEEWVLSIRVIFKALHIYNYSLAVFYSGLMRLRMKDGGRDSVSPLWSGDGNALKAILLYHFSNGVFIGGGLETGVTNLLKTLQGSNLRVLYVSNPALLPSVQPWN